MKASSTSAPSQRPVSLWKHVCATILALCFLSAGVCGAYAAPTPQGGEAELLARAGHLARAHQNQAAANVYERILKSDPGSLEALNNLGVLYARMGKYRRAAGAYERALHLNPTSFPLLVNLGLVYFKSGDLRAAAGTLERAVKMRPANFQARSLLAMSYYGAKDFQDAAPEFEQLVTAKPENSTLQYLLAESYLHSGQDQKLLDYFQQLLRRSPRSATVDMLMGQADDGLDRTNEAIKEFKAAAAIAPERPDVNFGLGYLYWKNREYDMAAKAFEREISNGGDVAKSQAYLADIALKQGKPDQARALAERAIYHFPDIRIAHYDLGIIDAAEKHYAAAEAEFKQAIRLDPSRVEARYRLAEVYRAEGKISLAKAELSEVGQIHQQHSEKLLNEISGGQPPK